MRRTELLLPAGSPEGLKTALRYGADAVYLGGEAYGLRAKARNFSMDEILSGVRYAHERGARVYVTANILARNGDLSGVREYFRELRGSGVDAVLIADPGIFLLAREEMPEMELHISTQANCTNYESFLFRSSLRSGGGSPHRSRSRPLCTGRCACPIPEDASSPIS